MRTGKFIFFLIIMMGFSFRVAGEQSGKKNDQPKLSSPYQTIYTHLANLQEDNYKPSVAAQTINAKDPANAGKLAVQLKQILDGKGLYVNLDKLPRNPNYYDSTTEQHKYVLFKEYPSIYVEKTGGKWLYSGETARAIPGLFKEVFPFGTHRLVELVPKIGQKKILGLAIWKHIGILIIIFISFLGYKLFTWIFNFFIFRSLKKFLTLKESARFVRSISKSLSFLLVLILINITIPILQLPPKVSHYLFLSLKALLPFFVMLILYRAVDILSTYLESIAEKTESTLDDQLVPLVRKSLKIFVVVIGILFILQNLEFNITALLAGLSIGGLALALAAQESLKNLFGSLMIFIDRPFQVGDYIIAPGLEGMVEEVGFRSTRIRSFYKSLVSIPNGKLSDMTIDNMGLRQYRRLLTKVAITYDTPPDLIEAFIEGIRKLIKEHPQTWKEYYHVRFYEMDNSSLNILVYCFFDVPDWTGELEAREEILLSITRLAEDLGVRFAFPTSTIHVEEFPGEKSLTPHYKEDKEGFMKKMNQFFKGKKKG